ncbi:TerD family protein [Ruminococcus albus]|uniref:Stress response protein SCP2 n=1 Tax=Ruminococcus albus TaxID=1264 RepID=A0A1I1PAA7_RUMAL|nr:TerD family protein [Ruminococcus albus]SFD06626.1 Stress response protein SCP2 [Ruminococcus albus]
MDNINLSGTQCGLVTYKINDDILAEVLANNGITGVDFDSASGVRTVRDEDGLIFAKEGGETDLPQMLFMAWSGSDPASLNAEDKSVFDEMKCTIGAHGRADCLSYKIVSAIDDTAESKLKAVADLFANTDIADKLDITVTRSSYSEGEQTSGTFGFERRGFKNGSQVFWQLNFAGESYSEDSAALLFKDGRLSITDRNGIEWEKNLAEKFMISLNDASAIGGVTVLEKLSCKNIEKLTLLPVFLEISDGALMECADLREVDILKKNIVLGRGFAGKDVVIGGCKGSTAEHYAKTNGADFILLEEPERKPMEFEIADEVCITADDYSVLRGEDKNRLTLNDVGFTLYEGCSDDFDCEIITMTSSEAAESGLTAQLCNFGQMIDTETVRNDRNGYIKATMMKSSAQQDIFSCVLEIDHAGNIICIHAEKQFTAEDMEKGAEKAMFARMKQLGESVRFGSIAEPGTAAVPQAVVAKAETVVEEIPAVEPELEIAAEVPVVEEAAIPEYEPEIESAQPAVEEITAPESEPEIVAEEPVVEEISATELDAVVEEPVIVEISTPVSEIASEEQVVEVFSAIESELETVSEEPVAEEIPVVESEPEIVSEEPVAEEIPAIEQEPEIVAAETDDNIPEAAAEVVGEQNDTSDDEIIDVSPEDITDAEESGAVNLVSGARFDLNEYASQMLVIDMDYQAEEGLDIDGYIFLLNDSGKVRSDADLVFFGQKASVDKAVNNHPQHTRMFTVELSKLDADITKLAVAFAIYGDKEGQEFSRVSKPTVRISCGGKELCNYEIPGLDDERSVVALEIYNKNGWKVKTIGLGFKLALKTLCGSYGVDVRD